MENVSVRNTCYDLRERERERERDKVAATSSLLFQLMHFITF